MNKDVKNEINFDFDDKNIDIVKETKKSPINSQINNILNNSLHDDNDSKIINKILSMDDISKSSSKKNVTETIKNSMVKVSSFLTMCTSKDSFDSIIDPSFNDNEILDNFKSISNSCDTIIQNDSNNIITQIEESPDISDVSTNNTLYSIKEEEIKENIQIIEEEVKENIQIIEEEVKEDTIIDEPKKKRTYKPRKKKTN
jgi:hypothetical protein